MTYRVLVADDEALIRRLVARVCERLGWEYDTAGNGNEALDLMKRRSHEVFILDMKMPGPSGVDLARRVSEFEEAPAVLILTGHADVDSAVAAMKEGVFDFVQKPVSLENLKVILLRAAQYHEESKRNIEARKKAEKASRFKSEFLSQMSFEMRTPLNGILGMAKFLLDMDLTDDQRLFVETIHDSAVSLHSLVNDIQDLSKIEKRSLDIEAHDFDLQTVVKEAMSGVEKKMERRGVRLVYRIEEDLPGLLRGDGACLADGVMILLEDALKYCEGNEIVLSVSQIERTADEIELLCAVSEVGDQRWDEDERNRLTREGYPGADIRASLLRDLVDMLKGEMWVETEGEKIVRLCLSAPFKAQLSEERIEAGEGIEKPCRILLVDDGNVSRAVTAGFLRKVGCAVTPAENGRVALDLLRSESFDLVFMDLEMPVMNGWETVKEIRQDPRLKAIPVVALTAHAMNGDRERCQQAGMDDYLSKPVTFESIVQVVHKWAKPESITP